MPTPPTDGPEVTPPVSVASLPLAVPGDDPADLVVDPADGVVRSRLSVTVGMDYADPSRVAVRAADGTVQFLEVTDVHLPDVHPTDPGEVVEVGDVAGTVTFGGDA